MTKTLLIKVLFSLKINLSIKKDSITFITGPSGAGKSTLFKLIALIEQPTQGKILIAGQDTTHLRNETIASFRQQLGIVLQDPMLLYDRNVIENIALGLRISGYSTADIKELSHAALSSVQMSKYAHYNPFSLSSGQKQRVGLARALARSPKILIADEPTGNLDPKLSEEIMQLLIDLNDHQQTCILIATHEQSMVSRFTQYINSSSTIHLDQGSLVN